MFYISFILFVLFFENLQTANGQVSEGLPCETPNEEYGTCININNCNILLDMLVVNNSDPKLRTYLRSFICGYVENIPLVCCPQPKPKSNWTTRRPSSSDIPSSTTPLPRTPNCGFSNITNRRVVNGVPAKLGQFPWIVALGYISSKNVNQLKWLCGGTLITSRHILTAGHCVYGRNDLSVARLGDLDLFSNDDGATPETIPFIKAKIHENYSRSNFTNDIAILTLERAPSISSIWPICLPVDEPLRSRSLVKFRPIVAGWGSLYFNGPSSPTLQEVAIPIVDNKQCKRVFGTKAIIDDRVLCAGYIAGGKDACKGDSGGPLMFGTNEGTHVRFHQVGIVSYGSKCAEAGYPGVYTKVTSFIDWIQSNLD